MSEKEKSKNVNDQKCIYIGRRISTKNKILNVFKKPNGQEMCFSGMRGVYIGYTYACGETSISAKPKRLDDERVDNPEWDAADALVDAKNAEARAEKRIADSAKPALKNAIESLEPLMKNLDYFSRKSLVEYLASRAYKKSQGKK